MCRSSPRPEKYEREYRVPQESKDSRVPPESKD